VLTAALKDDIPAGGQRTDYLRARIENGIISVFNRQDSGMLAPLSRANALLINPANGPSRSANSKAQYLRLN
jgi:molybdopterin molybdotransferase